MGHPPPSHSSRMLSPTPPPLPVPCPPPQPPPRLSPRREPSGPTYAIVAPPRASSRPSPEGAQHQRFTVCSEGRTEGFRNQWGGALGAWGLEKWEVYREGRRGLNAVMHYLCLNVGASKRPLAMGGAFPRTGVSATYFTCISRYLGALISRGGGGGRLMTAPSVQHLFALQA